MRSKFNRRFHFALHKLMFTRRRCAPDASDAQRSRVMGGAAVFPLGHPTQADRSPPNVPNAPLCRNPNGANEAKPNVIAPPAMNWAGGAHASLHATCGISFGSLAPSSEK